MVVGKCDACQHLVMSGESPACVAACSTRALHFGELEELRKRYGPDGLVSAFVGIPSDKLTQPSLLIVVKAEMLQK
jgi:anaerobic dimethyl sulfoxide reductase subunit B (iron-sulfur subunit)